MKNLYWIAGLLEGEGCFGFYNNCPTIQVNMTDKDVIDKAKIILDIENNNEVRKQIKDIKRKDIYCLNISGSIAIQWMMTLYSLMSLRRKNKIKEIINLWKNYKPEFNPVQSGQRSNIVRNLIRAGLSKEDAQKTYQKLKIQLGEI